MISGLLIAAAKETVLTNLLATRMAGLKTIGVDLIPFALTLMIDRTDRTSAPIVVIDIGENTTIFVNSVKGVPPVRAAHRNGR